MVQALIAAVFYLAVGLLCWRRPNAGRIFLGIFFLLMAFGVNLTIMFVQPDLFQQIGSASVIPLYRWVCDNIVAWNPLLFGTVLILYETAAGLLLRGGLLLLVPSGVQPLPGRHGSPDPNFLSGEGPSPLRSMAPKTACMIPHSRPRPAPAAPAGAPAFAPSACSPDPGTGRPARSASTSNRPSGGTAADSTRAGRSPP